MLRLAIRPVLLALILALLPRATVAAAMPDVSVGIIETGEHSLSRELRAINAPVRDVTDDLRAGRLNLSGIDLLMMGSYITKDKALADAIASQASVIHSFVANGGTVVELHQRATAQGGVAWLPKGFSAERKDLDYRIIRAIRPKHPVFAGFSGHGDKPLLNLRAVYNELFFYAHWAWRNADRRWGAFREQRGFDVLAAHDVFCYWPALMLAAHGKGRILLSSMALDRPVMPRIGADATLDESRGTRLLLKNMIAFAARVRAGKAPAVTPIVVPEEILEPKLYDIFAGLPEGEDRLKRVYLSGLWKLRKIPNTVTPARENKELESWTGAEEIPANDVGLKEHFWKENLDDSRWPEHFVPWEWNKEFPTGYGRHFGGVGWYRRRFSVPQLEPGTRVLLHFEYVADRETVWVNGKKVGSYALFERHPGGIMTRGHGNGAHDYDITDLVRPGKQDTLVVRVFAAGLHGQGAKAMKNELGGIWQPVWIDMKPAVYAERVLVTPNVGKGQVTTECLMVNTHPQAKTMDIGISIKPWQSYRYRPKGSQERFALTLRQREIPPGKSSMRASLDMKDAVTWDVENPFLYHVQVYAAQHGTSTLIGQARFGFRETTIRGDRFYMNGKRLFLPGVQTNEPYLSGKSCYRTYNVNHNIATWYAAQRAVNVFYDRQHSGHRVETFYDIADEVGFMICKERLLPPMNLATPVQPEAVRNWPKLVKAITRHARDPETPTFKTLWELMPQDLRKTLQDLPAGGTPGKALQAALVRRINETLEKLGYYTTWLNPRLWLDMGRYPSDLAPHLSDRREKRVTTAVRNLIHAGYNHPCVISYSLGNEQLSTNGVERTKRFFAAHNAMYDLYKRFDKTRPITACSGSNSILYYQRTGGDWPKEDFHDMHGATGGVYLQWPRLLAEVKKCKDFYRKVTGETKPFVDGEMYSDPPRMLSRAVWRRPYKELADTLPDLDRKVYVKLMRDIFDKTHPALSGSNRYILYEHARVGIGIRGALRDWDEVFAEKLGRFIQVFRRDAGQTLAGFNLHALDKTLFDETETPCVRRALKDNLSPVFLCCDMFDRNVFAGGDLTPTLHVLNDSPRAVTDLAVRIRVADENKRIVCAAKRNVKAIQPGEPLVFRQTLSLPGNLATGHYTLEVALLNAGNGLVSGTDYPLFVLGEPWRKFRVQTNKRILAYFAANERARHARTVLRRLAVPFQETDDFSALENCDVLILGPHSIDKTVLGANAALSKWLKNGGRLLSFSQKLGPMPFMPGMQITPTGNPAWGYATLVDVITAKHPVFSGFTPRDWQMWNSDKGSRSLCNASALPLNESVLGAAYHNPAIQVGMAIAEIKMGKGICFLSQVEALNRYGSDSVATAYVQNLLRYTLQQAWGPEYAGPSPLSVAQFEPPAVTDCFTVNLRPYCNMGFVDAKAGDKTGGWTDEGPREDLYNAPVGRQIFLGVPFDVILARKNKGRSCIVLKGKHRPYFPEAVHSIKIGRRVKRLFFLVTGVWMPSNGTDQARITFHYEPGGMGITRHNELVLKERKNITDWTHVSRKLSAAQIAWMNTHRHKNETVALYLVAWENPLPEERVETISLFSAGKGIPIFLAVTAEGAK